MKNNDLIIPEHRPTRSDAVKNRELLLDTAIRLFTQQGVESVSMSQLASEAGVGKGTLYRHFTNKTEVCQALLDQDQRDLQERTLLRTRQILDPLDNLCWFLEEVARFVLRNDELLAAASEASRTPSIAFVAHLWWRLTIRGLLQRMSIPGDIDYSADVLYVMLDVNTIRFQHHNLGYDANRIINGLHTTLHHLIR